MTAPTKNGAPRRQLSEQIDRLDGVIDALDEGLKGAVADAVRDAVGAAVNEAVQGVLLELMTNPELRKMVQQSAAEQTHEDDEPRTSGSLLSRLWARVSSAARSCAEGIGVALRLARAAWSVAGCKAKALALAGAAAAAGAAFAARGKIASAATAGVVLLKGLLAKAGGCLGRLAPAFAR